MDVLREQGLSCPAFAELSPAGRLDKDTEGLLLITNDGELIHRLLAPGRHVEKIYYARVRGEMTETDKNAFATGIVCSDFTALPAELELLRVEGGESEILLHLEEGKFHQVKRMVQAVGKEVLYLKRLSMGALRLDDALQPGEWRELTKEEKEALGCQEKKG
jgi:16S rRNA pseudouridine516 synthase